VQCSVCLPIGDLVVSRDDGHLICPKASLCFVMVVASLRSMLRNTQATDMATKMLERTRAGYGLDLRANMGIVADDLSLARSWKWMQASNLSNRLAFFQLSCR